jgi:hypothetical protein
MVISCILCVPRFQNEKTTEHSEHTEIKYLSAAFILLRRPQGGFQGRIERLNALQSYKSVHFDALPENQGGGEALDAQIHCNKLIFINIHPDHGYSALKGFVQGIDDRVLAATRSTPVGAEIDYRDTASDGKFKLMF